MIADALLGASTALYLFGATREEKGMRSFYLGGATCSLAAFLDQGLLVGAAGASLFIGIHAWKLRRLRQGAEPPTTPALPKQADQAQSCLICGGCVLESEHAIATAWEDHRE